MSRSVVQWIRIQTAHRCQAAPGSVGDIRVVCALPAEWEAVRITGPDGRPISLTPPRLRCELHFPISTDTVENRKETW